MKWAYLSDQDIADHLQFFSAQSGVPQPQQISVDSGNWKEKLNSAMAEYDAIVFGDFCVDKVDLQMAASYTDLQRINAIDVICKENDGRWWPQNLLVDAFRTLISKEIPEPDIANGALIIGTNGIARSAIAAIVDSGFSKFTITSHSREDSAKMCDEFQKLYFGVKFDIVEREKITLLPAQNSFVVNTISVFENRDMYQELYYCNYLKKGGVLLDLNRFPPETPLIKLADGIAGLRLFGYQFWAYYDALLAKNLFQASLPPTYVNDLKELYEKRTFDSSLILDLNF